jgi:hypothetical protein
MGAPAKRRAYTYLLEVAKRKKAVSVVAIAIAALNGDLCCRSSRFSTVAGSAQDGVSLSFAAAHCAELPGEKGEMQRMSFTHSSIARAPYQ